MVAPRHAVGALSVALALACSSSRAPEASAPAMAPAMEASPEALEDRQASRAKAGKSKRAPDGYGAAPAPAPAPAPMGKPSRDARVAESRSGAAPEAVAEEVEAAADAAPREWFPDSFLWVPLVQTDDDGLASLEVRVPDTLTTWRVLGLAHDRSGQQAGALHEFVTRLPVFLEPSSPAWLHVGDVLELPVRVGNATDGALTASVQVTASDAVSGGGSTTVPLPAGGVGRRTLTVRAEHQGSGALRAVVTAGGGRDEVVKELRVVPTGTPVDASSAGTLQGTVQLALSPAAGALDEELSVTVWPGPLAVLTGEVERLSRGGASGLPGFGLALAAEAEAAAARSGAPLDAALLRRVRLLAWQEVVRQLRTDDPLQAAALLLAGGADASVGGYEAARPGLERALVAGQRPDGTWSTQQNSTLQRVVAQTVTGARALPATATAARLRARGAVERNAPAADDAYTAAMVVGAGLADEGLTQLLLPRARAAIRRDDGGVAVGTTVPDGVVDAWGARPTEAELTAWTVLALPADDVDRGPLAAALLGAWTPGRGFGAGRGESVVVAALSAAVPGATAATTVSLVVDGEVAATAELDPARPHQVATLTARPGARMELKAEPPGAGLAWAGRRRGYVPLAPATLPGGAEVKVAPAAPLRAGVEGVVSVAVSAPVGARVELEQGLPAGVLAPREPILADRDVASVDVAFDRVTVGLQPFEGTTREFELRVTPAFAGRFTTSPLAVRIDGGAPIALAPMTWTVEP